MSAPDLSLDLPSIFPLFDRDHAQPASLAYMGACAMLRKKHPEADTPCPADSEQLADGTWVLRDLHHAPIATVTVLGVVTLAGETCPQAKFVRKPTAHPGIEVQESPMPEHRVTMAEVTVITTWRCTCGARWKKVGHHIGAWKVCRACGAGSWLRSAT